MNDCKLSSSFFLFCCCCKNSEQFKLFVRETIQKSSAKCFQRASSVAPPYLFCFNRSHAIFLINIVVAFSIEWSWKILENGRNPTTKWKWKIISPWCQLSSTYHSNFPPCRRSPFQLQQWQFRHQNCRIMFPTLPNSKHVELYCNHHVNSFLGGGMWSSGIFITNTEEEKTGVIWFLYCPFNDSWGNKGRSDMFRTDRIPYCCERREADRESYYALLPYHSVNNSGASVCSALRSIWNTGTMGTTKNCFHFS